MRKIIESKLVSLNGVIGDPHLWTMDYFDGEAEKHALDLLSTSDAMLMGSGPTSSSERLFRIEQAIKGIELMKSASMCFLPL